MTIGFFSDIHANLPALKAVFADLDKRKPDMLFCLGDLVGYAPWPNEVIDMIRERSITTIAGNYDEGVGLNSDDCGCAYRTEEDRSNGDKSIAYTNGVVTNDRRGYLRGLPRHARLTLEAPRRADTVPLHLLMVHGSPRLINEYLFEDRPDRSFVRMMEGANADIMFFGHTHKPYHRAIAYEVDGETRYRHAINIGSVGKPKDGDSRACYVLLSTGPDPSPADINSVQVDFVRVEYDVEEAARAIEASALPDAFARMLREAR